MGSCEEIVKILSPIIINYVLNQNQRHWFFGDALYFIIFTYHDFHQDLALMVFLNSLVNLEAYIFLIKSWKKKVLDVLNSFLSFLHCVAKKKGHNMLVLMLDPIFKSMHLLNIYASCDNVIVLIVAYDEELLPFLMEVYMFSMLSIVEESRDLALMGYK